MNRDKQLVGAAGEHLVLSRLLAKGILASQALGSQSAVRYLLYC